MVLNCNTMADRSFPKDPRGAAAALHWGNIFNFESELVDRPPHKISLQLKETSAKLKGVFGSK
eukprot:IDg6348t1